MTQREKILAKLERDGEITQVWAMHEYIMRLSERIRELEEDGYTFSKHFVVKDGKKTKTYRYVLESKPKRVVYELEERAQGVRVAVPRLV